MRVCPTGSPVKAHALVASAGFEHPASAVAPRTIRGATGSRMHQQTQFPPRAVLVFSVAEVVAKAADAAFGKPLVTNVLRAQIVEAMIALSLTSHWQWCSADYSPCDFQHDDGLRLEVKQSAARQTWSTDKPSKAIFDVASRTGRNEAAGWVEEQGRAAQIYVFAHNSTFDDTADHRDPAQWQFYVVPTYALPDVKQISLSRIMALSDGVSIAALADKVDEVAQHIRTERAV